MSGSGKKAKFIIIGQRDNSSTEEDNTGTHRVDASSGTHFIFGIYLSIALLMLVAVVVRSVRKRWNDWTKDHQDAGNAELAVPLCQRK